jgi:hypothetical protein
MPDWRTPSYRILKYSNDVRAIRRRRVPRRIGRRLFGRICGKIARMIFG